MRTKTALKNVFVAISSQCILLAVALFVRRLLLHSFDVELVAYDGLLSNVFSLLSLAELGATGLFEYRIYQAFAQNDTDRISKVLSMFRVAYCLIGTIVALICLLVFFLLPVIFTDRVHLWGYFRIMYVFYAASTVGTYFLSYWRILLVAGQKEYKIVAVQTAFNTGTQFAKLIILWTIKSYLLYLLLTCFTNITVLLLTRWYAKKEYPEIQIVPVSAADFKREGMFREIREVLVIRISGTIMNSTDNMLILMLVNTASAAFYNNYCLIGSNVTNLFFKLTQPMRATVADLVNRENKTASYSVFQTFDLGCFFLAAILFVCYGVVFQSAITVFFGDQFLLSYTFVISYALQNYVNMRSQAVGQFRSTFGEYHVERFYSLIGMVLNIVVSLIFGRLFGIAGIVAGTIISLLAFWNGYAVIVIRHFYEKSMVRFWLREIVFLIVAFAEFVVTYFLTYGLAYTLSGTILRGVIGVLVPTALNILLFHRTEAFRGAIYRLRLSLNSYFKKNEN